MHRYNIFSIAARRVWHILMMDSFLNGNDYPICQLFVLKDCEKLALISFKNFKHLQNASSSSVRPHISEKKK
jgi:hypothetical protein